MDEYAEVVMERANRGSRLHWFCLAAGAALCGLLGGCAALTNPVADGVPVLSLPPEVLGEPLSTKKEIPLSSLGQKPPVAYRLAPGDVLGVWIEGVLGEEKLPPQFQPPPQVFIREQRQLPPGVGFPIRVDPDGTITLPQSNPIPVAGLTIEEARAVIRDQLVKQGILNAGNSKRIIVTLQFPRQYHVIVMREEANSSTISSEGLQSVGKRGTGHEVYLPAYENDVLHALAQTGGLPGLDASDEVIIHRTCQPQGIPELPPGIVPSLPPVPGPPSPGLQIIKIPLRWKPCNPLPFHCEDIVLQSGDVVYLKPRDTEVYFTSGLLPAGEHVLPRDTDLDVIQAILRARGPMVNGDVAVSNLSGNLIAPGLGNPSARLLTVIRRLPDGCTIPIRIDIHQALRDARQRINVLPGDVLVLQDTPEDAFVRWATTTFFNFNLFWEPVHSTFAKGFVNVAAPDRLTESSQSASTVLP